MKAELMLGDLQRMIKATKKFTDINRGQLSRIILFFDKEDKMCRAYSCNGFELSVEYCHLISIDESFFVQVGPNLPYGDEEGNVFVEKTFDIDDVSKAKIYTKCSNVSYPQIEGEPFKFNDIIPEFNTEKRCWIGVGARKLKNILKSIENEDVIMFEFNNENKNQPIMLRLTKGRARMLMPVRLNEDKLKYEYFDKDMKIIGGYENE